MRRLLRYLLTKCNQPALDLERQRHELRQAQLEVWIVLDKIAQLLDEQQKIERQRWQHQYERK